ncbi:MAG: chemotaxis protein CheW [Crocosphaera sp.]
MNKDYFGVELSQSVNLALPLENMGTVIQIKPEKICLVPGVSDYLLGVINHQGTLLWVLDTEQFLQLESDGNTWKQSLTAIIMKSTLPGTRKKVALVVKKIQGVLNLNTQSKLTSSNCVLSQFQCFLDRIVMNNNVAFGILDTETIFKIIQTKVN